MSELSVTVIDVAWGDSILVESVDDAGVRRFGLVDCNDYEYLRSALIFVKRRLERLGIDSDTQKPNFDWVLLTHGHADHARGLKRMMATFGTKHFWYPKSVESTTYGSLLRYANRSMLVGHHQAIDNTKRLEAPEVEFGEVVLEVLWPNRNQIDRTNENNNSVVLSLTLDQTSFVLTGDCEASNWPAITERLPQNVAVFQVPHHGGRNGVFDDNDDTPWMEHLPADKTNLVLSSHIRPHGHPHQDVVSEIDRRDYAAYRTDEHYHVRVTTDGAAVDVKYSHV